MTTETTPNTPSPNSTKKSTYLIVGAIILAVLLAGIFYFSSKQTPGNKNSSPTSTTPTSSVNQNISSTPNISKTSKPVVKKPIIKTSNQTVSAPATLSYLDAIKIYRTSGYYFQFYPCQATPGSLTMKKGSKVMLDNRDTVTHVFAIGANHYTIKSYNFSIATVNTLGTNYVTCDGGGSATINVQP